MMQAVTLLAEGFSIKEAAAIMHIHANTVQTHWDLSKRKLGFRSYVDTVRYCIKHNLIDL